MANKSLQRPDFSNPIPTVSPTAEGGLEAQAQAQHISDPASLEGQTPGAIIALQHYTLSFGLIDNANKFEIGDLFKILDPNSYRGSQGARRPNNLILVQHLRSEWKVWLEIKAFFPVGKRQLCVCWNQGCRCIYEDFDKSLVCWSWLMFTSTMPCGIWRS